MRFPRLVTTQTVWDDAQREYAYTAGAEDVLRRARGERWTVVSLKNDWKTVFPD